MWSEATGTHQPVAEPARDSEVRAGTHYAISAAHIAAGWTASAVDLDVWVDLEHFECLGCDKRVDERLWAGDVCRVEVDL